MHGQVKVKANKDADLVLLAGVAERRHGQRAGSAAAAAVRLDDARSDDDGKDAVLPPWDVTLYQKLEISVGDVASSLAKPTAQAQSQSTSSSLAYSM